MNFDRFRFRCEASLFYFELINAIGQTLHVQRSLIVGRQNTAILIGIAGKVKNRSHPQARGVGHLDAQFTAIALAKERQCTKEEKPRKSFQKLAPDIAEWLGARACASSLSVQAPVHTDAASPARRCPEYSF